MIARSVRPVLVAALILGSAATDLSAQTDVRIEAYLGLARVHHERGDLAAAAADFEHAKELRALTLGEQTEYFWVLTGVDARRTLAIGRELLRTTPTNDDIRDATITAAISLADETAVVSLAKEGVATASDAVRWYRREAESCLRSGNLSDAADAYLQAANSPGGQASDRLAAATALTSSERFAAALAAWKAVPGPLLEDRPELDRLRLLSFVRSAPPAEAAGELGRWLRTHPDREVQAWLVEVWVTARNYPAAYAAVRPLTSGPDGDKWLRRSGELARSAGMLNEAAAAYDTLVRLPRATVADRVVLADIRLEQGDVAAALPVIDSLAASLQRCDEAMLSLIDRIPGQPGTDRVRMAADRNGCIDGRWGARIVERSVAEGRLELALTVLTQLSSPSPESTRLRGQLQLWTGSPHQAIATLQPHVADHPEDVEARLALVDALRAAQQPAEATAVAAPLFDHIALSVGAKATLASVAMESAQPELAVKVLRTVPAGQLTAPAAMVLIDATIATRGHEVARSTAEQFTQASPEWRDVVARRLTIALVTGHDDQAAVLRQQLCDADSTLCASAEAEAVRVFAAQWQKEQNAETLARMTRVAERLRLDATARAAVAGALLQAGQPDRALAVLTVDGEPLSSDGRTVLARVLTQLAAARQRTGDRQEALALARHALDNDSTYAQAWFVAFDAAIATGQREVADVLQAFTRIAIDDPTLLVAVGDHVSGVVQGAREVAVRQLIAMLQDAPASPTTAPNLTEARLYAALEDWPAALHALDAELARVPQSRDALRLRADVLGWSGQHVAGIEAYDAYLARAPSDVDAQRQQARVAGWGGRFTEANRRYAVLIKRYPDNQIVKAEATAKRAFYAGLWRDAVRSYDAWIHLEPDNSEARFERAVALRSAGEVRQADAALADLAADTGHRLATLALTQSQAVRHPAVTVTSDLDSSSGYGGTRLLTMQQQRAMLALPVGTGAVARVSLTAGQVRAEANDRSEPGFRGSVNAHVDLSPRVTVDGTAGLWNFSSVTTPDTRVGATWRSADRVAITGGVLQQPIHENLSTVDSGLTGHGPFAGFRLVTARASIDTTASWQRLSDGNGRSEVTISAGRVVSERLQSVRLIAWGQNLRYASSRSYYFSPGTFLRVDGGAEFTRLLQRPRFAGDRQSSFAVSFVEGTDNHGVLYHHPAARVHWQLSRRLALDSQGNWIRSSSYHESSFVIGLDVANLTRSN